MHDDLYPALRQCIIDGDPEQAKELCQRALAAGMAPLDAINEGLVPGLNHVG